jgi:hypothetical protein
MTSQDDVQHLAERARHRSRAIEPAMPNAETKSRERYVVTQDEPVALHVLQPVGLERKPRHHTPAKIVAPNSRHGFWTVWQRAGAWLRRGRKVHCWELAIGHLKNASVRTVLGVCFFYERIQ